MAGILIVAPHADDEVLGCGGVAAMGGEIRWLVCADEKKPHDEVNAFFDFSEMFKMNLPDGRFDEHSFGNIVKGIADVVHSVKPDVVYMPFYKDVHSDHRIIADAVSAVCKPFRAPFVKILLMYEVLTQTNLSMESFVPNYFVDITPYMDRKIEAIKIYGDELMNMARGQKEVEALAIYRGSFINVQYAEAFQVVRIISG